MVLFGLVVSGKQPSTSHPLCRVQCPSVWVPACDTTALASQLPQYHRLHIFRLLHLISILFTIYFSVKNVMRSDATAASQSKSARITAQTVYLKYQVQVYGLKRTGLPNAISASASMTLKLIKKDALVIVFRVPVVGIHSLWCPRILLKERIREHWIARESLPFFSIATTVDGTLLKLA